jgi:hypothetical protein
MRRAFLVLAAVAAFAGAMPTAVAQSGTSPEGWRKMIEDARKAARTYQRKQQGLPTGPQAYEGYYYFAFDRRSGPQELLGIGGHTLCIPEGWKLDPYLRENRVRFRGAPYKSLDEALRYLRSDICQVIAASETSTAPELATLKKDYKALAREPEVPWPEVIAETRKEVTSRCNESRHKALDCACVAETYEKAARARKVPSGDPNIVAYDFVYRERRNSKTVCTDEKAVVGAAAKQCIDTIQYYGNNAALRALAEPQRKSYCDCVGQTVLAAYLKKPIAIDDSLDKLIRKTGIEVAACKSQGKP